MMTGQLQYRHMSVSQFLLTVREVTRFDYLHLENRSARSIDCAESVSEN